MFNISLFFGKEIYFVQQRITKPEHVSITLLYIYGILEKNLTGFQPFIIRVEF